MTSQSLPITQPVPQSLAQSAPRALPQALEAWRDWLTLFPPELTDAIGQMLLRLDPLVGRLKFASHRTNDEPVGIGNIVQRGNYDRLLMTEWLYAEAEPDEFIRRAASNELLFLGTEPDIRLRSQLCIALFDAGPMQLGEPRLAHIVLFILLSRRAEEAGAHFKWGILQHPGVLHETQGREAMKALLNSKSLRNATTVELDSWDTLLKQQDKNTCDCWQISGTHTARLQRATSLITSHVDLFSDEQNRRLHLQLSQRSNQRDVILDLPAEDVVIRILREQFKRIDGLAHVRNAKNRPSQKQAPRFASKGYWLAVPQLDGNIIIYNVPQSVRAAPGKFRTIRQPTKGSILAAAVMGKNLAYISADGTDLSFHGFPSQHFSCKKVVVQRPEMKYFRAPTGGTRWLPAYFMEVRKNARSLARVIVQDIDQHLVCWESSLELPQATGKPTSARPEPSEPHFKPIASNVIGSDFFGHRLLYAVTENASTKIFRWHAHENAPLAVANISHAGQAIFFGNEISWTHVNNFEHGLLALQIGEHEWWIGTSKSYIKKSVPASVKVLGVTNRRQYGEDEFGLVVLSADKHSIQFIGQAKQIEIHRSAEPIAKISMDSVSSRLAWILQNTLDIKVRGLDEEALLLKVTADGVSA
jgi:hypothetical protein